MSLKWDLHHHAVPDFYVEAMRSAGVSGAGGFRFPRWTPERSLRAMDSLGVERAWLSVSAPGVCVPGIADPAALARRLNDTGAAVVARRPDRFGWFVTLPQVDVAASLAEIERVDAREVVLLSNVDDVHFGHPGLDPLWSELNARQAIVYVHPAGRPGTDDAGLLNPLYLWQNDTARSMLDFLRAGGHVRFPRIRWVLSHGGGPLPVVLDDALAGLRQVRPGIDRELAAWRPRVFLDTASKAYAEQVPAVIAFGGPGQVTYGSDFPWARRAAGAIVGRAYDRAGLGGVFKDNAMRLFARQDSPVRTTEVPDTGFPRSTGPQPGGDPLPGGFWTGGDAAVRDRIVRHNDACGTGSLAVVDMTQPEFSIGELSRCRGRQVTGIRVPLDLSAGFLDQRLLDALADGTDLLRFEPRSGGIPLLDDGRLDAVLFCAQGHWLRRLDSIDPSRVILAGTAGLIPYVARPIDILHYLGRGKLGALAYAWATFVVRRPAGYRWLEATRRE
ncbi:amidohydrolase family protein [Actinoplanes sp. N902-109]|uniref:amidohydrolase family protein n=1 Tax=Actinoplanes sp. (strain N902-109) TaxID=649831 RepID=UPI00032962F0|nr:amidohydrolase family protein [Actinoplanes sp. N902-109]AGL15864.1 amidohydrolase 2 [Actinoplanes sp. N902-109]